MKIITSSLPLPWSFKCQFNCKQIILVVRTFYQTRLLTETWLREGEFIHPNEFYPNGCSVFGLPHSSSCGGGLAVVFRDSFTCKMMNIPTFSWFETLMVKVGFAYSFHCLLVYHPPWTCCCVFKEWKNKKME